MRRAIVSVTLTVTALACASAAAGGGPRITARIKPTVVEYTRAITLAGQAPRSGLSLDLEVRRFPFADGESRVGRHHAGKHGRYAFHDRPSHAARYRIALSRDHSVSSRVVRAYVEPRVSKLRCNLCGASSRRPGRHTLRFSYRLRYPPDTYAIEAPKRVQFYYGQRDGSDAHPRRLRRVKGVRQTPLAHHRTRVVIIHRVRLPGLYALALAACTKTSERVDGLGLPGAPGSRRCGAPWITYGQSLHWLG